MVLPVSRYHAVHRENVLFKYFVNAIAVHNKMHTRLISS